MHLWKDDFSEAPMEENRCRPGKRKEKSVFGLHVEDRVHTKALGQENTWAHFRGLKRESAKGLGLRWSDPGHPGYQACEPQRVFTKKGL